MTFQKLLNSKNFVIFIIPLFLGSLSVLSFQPVNFTFINFFILPSLFLLITYVQKRSRNIYRKKPYLGNLFLIGYFFGIGFFLSGTYWISYSLTFDENLEFLIPISLILIPLFLGLFFGLGSLLCGPFLKNSYSSFFLFCFTFSLIDYLRGNILSGFPWNLWSYSWSWFVEIIQILNPIGLYAFNSLSIIFFSFPAILFFKTKYKYLVSFSFLLILFSFYIYGSYKINNNQILIDRNEQTAYVKAISPNFEMRYIKSDDEIKNAIQKVIKYSDPEFKKETIFVWPEGIFAGVYFEDLKRFKNLFNKNFSENHLIILGINTEDNLKDNFYNSILVVNNKLEILYRYDKEKLVPFGEFLPLNNFFEKLGLKKITQGYGSFSSGKNQNNFKLNNLSILPLICYEIIFPELIQSTDNNSNLIINISEDAWFGNSIGPHQHFAKAVFRSIENNTFVVRSANKGISAFINNNGKVIKSLKPNEKGSIELNVPLINKKTKNNNDLIFFVLLFTYMIIFLTLKNKL